MERPSPRFIPALEGVRGYAFIAVFAVHFQHDNLTPLHLWQMPRFLFISLGWLAVPIFFVISGYLITEILLRTKDRAGYFKVFYARRALRVLPLYYISLAIVAVGVWLRHWHWSWKYLWFLCYAQNLTRSRSIWAIGPHVALGHFWSLALEEQFYLVWPIVIWLCPTRRAVMRVCYFILVASFLIRLAWPLFHLPIDMAYCHPLTRGDEIVCGALVALHKGSAKIPAWLVKWSEWAVGISTVILLARALQAGSSMPQIYTNIVVMIPLANIVCTAMLILLLAEETSISRMCSQPWICGLGRLSYGLYIFHGILLGYFIELSLWLTPAYGRIPARILCMTAGFLVTWAIAYIAYRLIEMPALRAKDLLFRYDQAGRLERDKMSTNSPESDSTLTGGDGQLLPRGV